MKRTAPLPPTDKVRNFTRKALHALGFINLNPAAEAHEPLLAKVKTSIGPEAQEPSRPPAMPRPLIPQPSGQTRITQEDWDIMFCAIQLRLTHAVAERARAAPLPQQDDAADRLDVLVLECVSEMGRLHEALKQERSQGAAQVESGCY